MSVYDRTHNQSEIYGLMKMLCLSVTGLYTKVGHTHQSE